MEFYKIVTLVLACFQIVMGFFAIPLFKFLMFYQKNIVQIDNRLKALEDSQITHKERQDDSNRLVKIEIMLDQGDKRMGNIERNLRVLINDRVNPES